MSSSGSEFIGSNRRTHSALTVGSAVMNQSIDPKKKGPPSLYNEALAEAICDRLADGESLNAICKSEGMPSERTVRTWARTPDHPFSPKYARARELGYLKLADELLEIADDGTNDWMKRTGKDGEDLGWAVNGEHIARSRLRVDTRKWLLSKCLPKVFGDRITAEHTGSDAVPVRLIDSRMTAKEAAAAYEEAIKAVPPTDFEVITRRAADEAE
jgi:hypothetical protein